MPQIRCIGVRFFSPDDEATFFQWAAGVPGVVRVVGEGRQIVLVLRSRRVSKVALLELLALFHRYRISMRALADYENRSNTSWFRNPQGFWYKKVFA